LHNLSVEFPGYLSELFEKVPIRHIIEENWRKKRLVLVNSDQHVEKALERLNRHNITALPVVDTKNNKILGVLDILDIVDHASQVLSWETGKQINFNSSCWEFLYKPVRELVVGSKRKTCIVSEASSLAVAIQELSKGVHCCLVVPEEEPLQPKPVETPVELVSGLITQSDIVRFAAENIMWLNRPSYNMSIRELGLISSPVVSVSTSLPVREAFTFINQKYIHGVAVVDQNGKLVGNLSASNIKGITNRSFPVLRLSVAEFLKRDSRRKWWRRPVCVRETETLKLAILQFSSTRKHRMYIVDNDERPIGVVSLSDIVKKLLVIEPIAMSL